MARSVTLFTGQWADLKLSELCGKAKSFGYDGLELACWGDHFDVLNAGPAECRARQALLKKHGLKIFAISNHLVGQAVCDQIDSRHQSILPAAVWGDGKPESVRRRAAEHMIQAAEAAKRVGVKIVCGFTGSSIWPYLYSFPPVSSDTLSAGYRDFRKRWMPILDAFQKQGVKFALEAHPTEIAFDIVTAERALDAVDGHPAFGFNFDPSHLGYQGVDYVRFLRRFADRIFHVHIKDAAWAQTPGVSGVFGGHLSFGDSRRHWDFRSPGRGNIEFEPVIRALNEIQYSGPLSVEWEDSGMDREAGAREACAFVRRLDFPPSATAFDAAFEKSSS